MDQELAKMKVDNWLLWQQALSSAKVHESGKSHPPAIATAPLLAFLYYGSLFAFSAIAPAVQKYQLEMFIWSCFMGVITFLWLREKEKQLEETANYIFRDLVSEEKSRNRQR